MNHIQIPISGRDAGAKRSIPGLHLINRVHAPIHSGWLGRGISFVMPSRVDAPSRRQRIGAEAYA
ncbi:hypothetical protein DIE03_28970 [Burkholderia sp. Bp8992]|uniref:hypothetical protein n=1 Tax=Burkholderia sp. Bp8992 TaxID=2184554 RepID=UPI000F57951A|nr:hypothetical protein [Burkholderia sp. Bp8992]RQS23104.1 hypothetical protein DIE03_28970 [Burkholderia sp. Bp8992]